LDWPPRGVSRSGLLVSASGTAPGGHDILLIRVICFLVVIIVVVGRDCNPLRVPLSLLLATVGVLLGTLDGDARWRRSAAAGDRFPTAQDKERTDRLLIGAILGGDVDQLLGGVPDDIISSPKTWWLPRVMHACTLLPDTSSPSPLGPGLCPSRSTCPPRRRFSAQCLSWAPMSPWQA
jgi:hypothetical protein